MTDKPLDLNLLHIFVVVCEKKQLNEAAKALGVTSSAVSQALRKLEESLNNTKLFLRETRPLRLTNDGRRLLSEGRQLLHFSEELKTSISTDDISKMNFRVGFGESVSNSISPWIISELYKKVNSLETHSMFNKPLQVKLAQDELDVAIWCEPLYDQVGWQRYPIYEEEFLILTKKSSGCVSLSELKQYALSHPMISYNYDSWDQTAVDRLLRAEKIVPSSRIRVGSSYCLIGLVVECDGWSLISPMNLCAGRQFLNSIVVNPLPKNRAIKRTMWAVSKDFLSLKAEILAKIAREKFNVYMVREIESIYPELLRYVKLKNF